MNENSLIKDIGRSYIISSFLPASFFITIAAILFRDFVPSFIQNSFFIANAKIIEQLVLISLCSTWLGFLLYSSWFGIVRLYEGYLFMEPLYSFLLWFQEKRFDKNVEKFMRYKELLKNKRLTPEERRERDRLFPVVQSEMESLQIYFPQERRHLLPTRLGNVLRAYEEYSVTRYGVSGITVWPRLYQLLPNDIKIQLEERNNQFVFLLNSSLLSLIIAGVCLGLNFLLLPCWVIGQYPSKAYSISTSRYCSYVYYVNGSPANFFQRGFQTILPHEYLLIGLAFLALAYCVYRLSVFTAENMGLIVRSSFDLYRLELFEKLNRKRPQSLKEERELWDPISEFMMVGDALGRKPCNFEYIYKEDPGERQKEEPAIKVDAFLRSNKKNRRKR